MYITRADRKKILKGLPPLERAIFAVGVSTGLRISEILALEWAMVDPASPGLKKWKLPKRIMKGKTRGRVVDMNDAAEAALRALPVQRGEKVFTVSRPTVSRRLRRLLNIAPHDMRRIFITDCWRAIRDLYLVSLVAGHVDPRNTIRYIHRLGVKDLWTKVHRFQQRGQGSKAQESAPLKSLPSSKSPGFGATAARAESGMDAAPLATSSISSSRIRARKSRRSPIINCASQSGPHQKTTRPPEPAPRRRKRRRKYQNGIQQRAKH